MDDFWGDIYGVDADLDGDKDFDDFIIMDDLLNDDDKKSDYDDDDDYEDDDYEDDDYDDIDEDRFDFDIDDESEIDMAEMFDEISFETAEMLRQRLEKKNSYSSYVPYTPTSSNTTTNIPLNQNIEEIKKEEAEFPKDDSPNNYYEDYRKREDDIKAKKMLKTAGIFAIIMVVVIVAVLASGGDGDTAYAAFELLGIILLVVLFKMAGN